MFFYSRNSVANSLCGIKYNVPGLPKKKFVNNRHVFVLCMCVCVCRKFFHNILLYFSLFNVKIKMELVKNKKKSRYYASTAHSHTCTVYEFKLSEITIKALCSSIKIIRFKKTDSGLNFTEPGDIANCLNTMKKFIRLVKLIYI